MYTDDIPLKNKQTIFSVKKVEKENGFDIVIIHHLRNKDDKHSIVAINFQNNPSDWTALKSFFGDDVVDIENLIDKQS